MSSAETEIDDSKTSYLQARFDALPQVVRYLLIGGTASAIDVILFLALYEIVGTSALVAHSISVPTSVLFSFFTNARHNFHTNDHMLLRLISFVMVCIIGYLAGFAVILGVEQMGFDASVGKIASLPVVFVIQYVLNSKITFRPAPGPKTSRT